MTRPLKIDLPYVQYFKDRHGHERCYFRRKGFKTVALPHPDSDRFLDAYRKVSTPEAPSAKKPIMPVVKGTFGALIQDYRHSADFQQLAETTQREMGYVIDTLAKEHGDKRLSHLERRHILGWKDNLAKKPGAANKMLRTVKQLMTFAVDRGMRKDNPALGIAMMKLGRFRAWTDAEMAAFESKWSLGTLERTGYALALYTGQRRSDLVKLKWASIAGNEFRLTQQKTKTDLVIPIHPKLQTVLAKVHPRCEEAILAGPLGRPLNAVYFGAIMAEAISDASLPDDCVLHGLRKTTGRLLAEAGAKVAPITGHRSERMAAEYSRDAEQAKLARAAVLKWAGKKRAKR